MIKWPLYSFFVCIAFCVYSAKAQRVTFNKVIPPFGSFSGLVGGITQDNNGYLWLATQSGGLYRYDGYRFKAYLHDPANSNSISTNNLETVYADRKGIIWIVTYVEGIERFDPATGVFTHFRHNSNNRNSLGSDTVRSIIEDREGTLWIGTNNGLDRFNSKTKTFQHYQYNASDPSSLSCNQVRKVYEDKEGTIWVGTGSIWPGEGGETREGGLNRLDKKTGKFIRYMHDPNNPHSLIDNKVQAIYEDSRGTFFVGTAGDGLHAMDRRNGKFQRHPYNPSHPEALSRPPLKEGSFRDHITSITEDVLGNIWIATMSNGLNRFDAETKKTVHYGTKDSAIGYTDNSGWSLFNSKDGILWISTVEGGLYRVDPYHKNVPHIFTGSAVTAFQEDPANNLWIGTAQGLIIKNQKTGTIKKFVNNPFNENSLSGNDVSALLQDLEGVIWIGTNNGLNRFNAKSNTFTRYINNPDNPKSISPGNIFGIAEAGSDSLWLSTRNYGIDLMDKRTGNCRHFRNNPHDTNSLAKNFVVPLLSDEHGNLWAGLRLSGGLNYLDRKTGKAKHFLKGLSVLSLFRDSRGTLWVGTDVGIYSSLKANGDFTKLTYPSSGIEKTIAYAIQEDDQKIIWAITGNGIYRVNFQKNLTTLFSTGYGVRATNLNLGGSYKGSRHEIYFANQNGYYVFLPDKLIPNPAPPQIVLTDFRLNGKSILPGNSPLSEPLERTKKITLRHDQNTLAFDFAAIHFSSPENNRHIYKLENYDPEWREAGSEKTAYYFNISPGQYVFKVKAVSSEGVWVEKVVSIIIHPPFWATWWAYLIYALMAIGLIRWYLIFKERRLRTEQHLAYEKREAMRLKEVDELKDRFFSNITHEFRTPLTLIITPLEKLEQDPSLSAAAITTVRTAQRNSKQLLRLINEFLDFSKLNDGKLKLKLSTGELDLFTADSVRSFESAAKEKNIDLRFSAQGITGFYLFDEEKWEKIITNLLSNALKFTPANGIVSVSLSAADNIILLEVKDSGPGIPADQQEKIFTRFYQVDNSAIRSYGGTGIGLSLVKELTELMQGKIEVNSEPGAQTSFYVSIPMKKLDAPAYVPVTDDLISEKHIAVNNDQDIPLLLVVEDNDELRSFLAETMRKHYRVIEAADGLKAWEIILEELPDIVISDVMMPGQDGFDLCRLCKGDNRTAHISFILLTSKAAHDARLKGLGTGADDYIIKPFNLQELELRSANLLNLQQKLRAWLQVQLISTTPMDQLPEVTDPFLVELYQQMDAKLDDPQLGVDYLCKTTAMSRSTLNRKLKSLLGISTNDLIRQYRLQKASSLISSGLDISTVAYRVGFSSPSYFSQCFKEHFNITPSEYISKQS